MSPVSASASYETDLLQGLATYLNTSGVGAYKPSGGYQATDTAIVFGELPTGPDRAIAITLYASMDSAKENLSTVRVQLMFRGQANNSLDVGDLAASAFRYLQGLQETQFGSCYLIQAQRVSSVPLGLDGNKRTLRSDNYSFDINPPATPLRNY